MASIEKSESFTKGIPVLNVEGDCIARAWENSLISLYENGCDIKTQYDKPEDPPSKDATMIITVTDPLKEPMLHKDFPAGVEFLQEYVMEVCEGIKDHLVRDPNDPEGEFDADERVVVLSTGSGLKDVASAIQAVQRQPMVVEPVLAAVERALSARG